MNIKINKELREAIERVCINFIKNIPEDLEKISIYSKGEELSITYKKSKVQDSEGDGKNG